MQVKDFEVDTRVDFFHSDENRPFLSVYADMLTMEGSVVMVFSRDYEGPIAVVYEYDYWTENIAGVA